MASFQKYQTKDGFKWLYKIYTTTDPQTGKKKQTTKRGFKTKKEAQLHAAKTEMELDNGLFIDNKNILLATFINDWLLTYKKGKIRNHTFNLNTTAINKHIIPFFGVYKLLDITPDLCQKFVNHLLENGYSENSVKNYTAPLKGALLKAVDLQLIQQTPFRGIVIAKSDAEEKRIKHLEGKEVNAFVETLKETEHHYFALFFTLLHTGMRKGEALALQWSDIDLEEGTISIRHTFTYDYNNLDNLRAKPKTKASYRTILLADFLVKILKEHKLEQKKHKLKSGQKYHDLSLVFARENGLPYPKSTLQRAMTRILKKA
ncbi:site-specific integrase, partial [Bacillus cereus]